MKRIFLLSIFLLLLLAPSGLALASSSGRIIRDGETAGSITLVDDTLTVEEGGTVRGDVTIFSGSADIGGVVTGNVTIFGGSLALSGTVNGDLVLFGGDLEVREGAEIGGACFAFGGGVEDASDGVSCAVFGNRLGASRILGAIPPLMPELPSPPAVPDAPAPPEAPAPPRIEVRGPSFTSRVGGFFLYVSEVVGRSLLMGILALIITAIFPQQLRRIGDTVQRRPAASGAVGLLTAVAGPSLIALLLVALAITCVGLLLYPAVFLLGLALVAAALMGWVALGDILGRMLFRSFDVKGASLPVSAALGTGLLTLVLSAFGPFIWGAGLAIFLLVCVGLGGAALTQFGTRPYPPWEAPGEDPDKVGAALKTLPPEDEE